MAKLYFYYSTMNAGKSTSLLQSSHNYRERGMHTLVYTALLDQRGGGRVHSRIGLTSEARHFARDTELFRDVDAEHARRRVSCVLLDEAQFLTRPQVDEPTRQRATPPVTPVAPAKGKKPWAIIVGFLVLVLIIVVSAAALLATGETEAWQAAGK